MKLHNLFFKLFCLVWGQFELSDVIWAMEIRIIVSQLWLDCVGTQQSQGGKGAGQPPCKDVLSKLQTQVIPGGRKENTIHREQREIY